MDPPYRSWREVMDMEEPDNVEYVEHGILSPGNIWLIYAPEASFKSVVAMNVAIQLAEGRKVLDHFKAARKFRVLYLDKEVGLLWVRRRILDMLRDAPNGTADDLFLITKGDPAANIELDDHHTLAPLVTAIEETKPDVLVLDCLNPLLGEEESQRSFMQVEKSINTLSIRFPHLAFILVHHMHQLSEEDDPLTIQNARGSTKLTNMVATRMPMISLVGKHPGAYGRLKAKLFLRHGPTLTTEFWIDDHFRLVKDRPKKPSAIEGL